MTKVVIPVILCGGSGTRLWPASRENHPKQFLRLMNDSSLLQNTVKRALRIAGGNAENLVTVTLDNLAEEVIAQLSEINPAAAEHVLREPEARNTAAAIAFVASYVEKTFGSNTLIWILPADHHIGDENAMARAYNYGVQAALKGYLATFGIKPNRPETGYGYIRLGRKFSGGAICKAAEFVEKPDLATARAYLKSGDYLWNSGMFLFSTDIILAEYAKHSASILNDVRISMQLAMRPREAAMHPYGSIPSQPFDKAIMEKSLRVAIVPCDPAWSDIGSWESLWEIRRKDANGNVVEGRAACHDTRNCLIQAKDRLIACVGLEDIVVVETADALLIADRSNPDAMRALVGSLKKDECPEVTDKPLPSPRPWSMVLPAPHNNDFSVREFEVPVDKSLDFDAHGQTVRFLTVVSGQGSITLDGEEKPVNPQDTVFIPQDAAYSIANEGQFHLRIIEVNRTVGGVMRTGRAMVRKEVA
jgi:mannose-1-phosphate guanylyltransferase/mannose-6-phosphate isomerase